MKNRIRCALATSNTNVTLGFMVVGKAKPMTLLKGNELNSEKVQSLDLVLHKTRGECNFKEMFSACCFLRRHERNKSRYTDQREVFLPTIPTTGSK